MFDLEFLLDLFHVSEQLRKCDLTIEERCLLKGISMMSRDRCTNAESAEQIERSQEVLVEAFQRLINVNHPEERFLLARVIQILTDLRGIAAKMEEQMKKFLDDFKDLPLPDEMFIFH